MSLKEVDIKDINMLVMVTWKQPSHVCEMPHLAGKVGKLFQYSIIRFVVWVTYFHLIWFNTRLVIVDNLDLALKTHSIIS